MEISKLYEEAAAKLEKAADVCAKSAINLSTLTLVCTNKGNLYTGINWRTVNDSFEEEMTCSEREAIAKMLLAGETVIESIVTLDAATKAPVNPCQKCQELIINIDIANTMCKVLSGKNSHVTITSINNDIAKYAEKLAAQYQAEQTEKIDAVINEVNDEKAAHALNTAESAVPAAENPFTRDDLSGNPFASDPATDNAPAESAPVLNPFTHNTDPAENTNTETANNENTEKPIDGNETAAENDEPQGSAAHTGGNFNTADLQMLLSDDWESASDDTPAAEETKPFNASSLSNNQQEIINTVQNMSEDMHNQQNNPTPQTFGQQPANGMYQQQPVSNDMYQQQQPMNNGMYQQQPMNGMYQQQPMNGMYQQQPMNNGMYQQQPMNNGMYQQQPMNNGMYQQQPMNNGMYQQQPMNNGMYQQQQPMNNGMYQQQPMNNGMYQQQPMNNGMYQQQPMNNGMYQQQANAGSMYINQMPRGQQNSVYLNQPQQNSNNSSVYLNRMQAPISSGTQRPASATQSMSVYGKNANGDNNAIFKDKLNDILKGSQSKAEATSVAMEDVMQSAKDKKKAAKKNKK